jgi:hypothetical protein
MEQIVNDLTSTKIDFLKSIGSDKVNHAGDQTLLDHLVGTMDKLRDMGKPEYLQDAGLFHSVYGTTYFMPVKGLVDDRQVVKDLIGDQAEEIAWWFCMLEMPRTLQIRDNFEGQLREDLIALDIANREDIADTSVMTWDEAYGV